MTLKVPTRISILYAIYLCALAIFFPAKFEAIENKDKAVLEKQPNKQHGVSALRKALFQSFFLVLISAALGFGLSYPACNYLGPSHLWVEIVQIIGAMLFLWATLAVRGWDVQTFSGATLTERVNQWIYRILYCIATSILVLSVAWSYCR